jgi:hypothetical protein
VQRDIWVEAFDKIAQFLGITVDDTIHFEHAKTPAPVKEEDKTIIENYS